MKGPNKEDIRDDFSRTMRIDIAPSDAAALAATPPALKPIRGVSEGAPETTGSLRLDAGFVKMLESVYDAVLIADVGGVIVGLNDRAVDFFLYSRRRMIGAHVADLISGANHEIVEDIKRNLQSHRFALIEARCTRRDGSSFPAEIAVNRLKYADSDLFSFFVRDITVRKRALQALEDAVERLQAHDRSRSEFVSNVSHDLRTPLTSMIYAINNMLRGVVGPLPDRAVRYLERLDSDCRRLLATVNDILDIRQIENRSITLSKTRIPLGRLAESCVEVLRLQADEKGLSLTTDFNEQAGFVLCDPEKMERVLINVIGNAVKFTSGNGWVHVRADPDREHAGMSMVSVTDNGVGIPREALNKVTLRYFKVGEQPSGSGLGLAIAKEIVELHGGSITIDSPVPGTDRGSAVYIRLPMVDSPLILVAAGDAEQRELMRRQLVEHGYQVRCVDSGEKALAASETADALVLNLDLPDMEGTQVVLRLKQDKRTNRLPILALSGATLTLAHNEVFQSFGIPVLCVPWKLPDLLSRLGSAFYGKGAAGRLPMLNC